MGFRDCISSALNGGEISKEEAADLIRRFETLEAAESDSGSFFNGSFVPTTEKIKRRMSEDLRAEAVEKRRVQLLAVAATDRIRDDIERKFVQYDPVTDTYVRPHDVIEAAKSLFENFGTAGFQSVRGIYNALLGASHAEMNEFLHTFRRSQLTRERFNRPMLDEVAKAAFGESTSGEAKALYESWRNVAEKLRGLFNEAGGHIQELKDWGLPQSHNANALLTAGFDRWRDFISGRLDWDRMKHGVSGADILPAERDGVLRHVWESIVTDGWNTREPSAAGGGAALYNRRADSRFLIFKGADNWREYNTQFGKGDIFATMMDHVKSMSRDIALMQRLGPNPAATVRWLKQVIEQEGALAKTGQAGGLFPDTKPVLVDAKVFAANRQLDGFYDVARGSGVPYSTFGASMSIMRNVQYSAKLGGAVILHTFSNPVIQAMGRYLQGHSVLATPLEVLRNLGGEARELAQAGMIMQDAVNTLERGAREQGALLRVRELSNWLPSTTTHFSGLEHMVEANRRAAFMGQMTSYASLMDRDWKELPARNRAVLQGFGLTKEDWAHIRTIKPYSADGVPMLRFQDIPDQSVAMKYLELLHQSTEMMVPSSNWRVRSVTSQIGRDGTLAGEVVKSAMMFKGGFMATFMLTQMQQISAEIARNGRGAGAAYVGASAIALTVAGLLTLQAKNLRAGKDFRNMDVSTKEGRETWEHAFLTSGALGIYGDFIHSDRSSYGHNLISTLAGPMVTAAEDAFHGVKKVAGAAMNAAGLSHDAKAPNLESDGGKWLQNNTPVLSTHWALSAGYNRVILDQLQYLSDPQAHKKMRALEQRVMKETGQQYFWRPGQLAPDRLPGFTPSR